MNNKKLEYEQAKQERLTNTYNRIFISIEHMETSKQYLNIKKDLDAFSSECGRTSLEVLKLKQKLKNKVSSIIQTTDENIAKMNADIETIKRTKITDTKEDMERLEHESNNLLYTYMMQLSPNKDQTSNRRRVGNWAKSPTRSEATALLKLYALPQYQPLFTSKQKEVIVANARNPKQVQHEHLIQPMIDVKNRQIGETYMKGFMFRKIQNQLESEERGSVFDASTED